MTKFEEGDRIWWFEYPEQCLGKTKEIAICSDVIMEIARSSNDECVIFKEGAIALKYVDVYKSKDDAVFAMLRHIASFWDNEDDE